jgi:hypothetical protein
LATDDLPAVVARGDRRESLRAIRDRLADELQHAEGRDVAPIAKQLTEVIREIDALPNAAEVSEVADLAKRRESRRKAAGL